jgi:hypothetical protein
MKKSYLWVLALLSLVLVGFTPLTPHQPADDVPWSSSPADVLCGDGSEADQYGFSYDLQQYHWTVDGERYLQQATIDELDTIFDRLVDEQVVETMILFKPAEQVGNRVNCAVHFLRYMQLGQPNGQRKDNGFVFLFVVEKNSIDVHYGVGLGLPALTAHKLTELNRMAEEIYADTGSLDKAVLTMAYSFANYAREQYPPVLVQTPVSAGNSIDFPAQIANISAIPLTCLCCISIIVLVILLLLFSRIFRGGGRGGSTIFRPGPSVWPRSSGGSGRTWRPNNPTRGGGGSGRSHRGN